MKNKTIEQFIDESINAINFTIMSLDELQYINNLPAQLDNVNVLTATKLLLNASIDNLIFLRDHTELEIKPKQR